MWYKKSQRINPSGDFVRSEIERLYSESPQWQKILPPYNTPEHKHKLEVVSKEFFDAVKKYGGWEPFREEYERQLQKLYKEMSTQFPKATLTDHGAYYLLSEGELLPVVYEHQEIDQVILGRMGISPHMALPDTLVGDNLGRAISIRKYPYGSLLKGKSSIQLLHQPTNKQVKALSDMDNPNNTYILAPGGYNPEDKIIHTQYLSKALLSMDILPKYNQYKSFSPHPQIKHILKDYPELFHT